MATSETLVGFFRRFSEKSWVGGMHHYFNLTRVFNILETIRGDGGIVVEKDIGGKGYNWVVRFTNALANLLGDADLADSGDQATGTKRSSIQQRVVTVDSEEVTVYELHNFAAPGTVAVAEGTDPDMARQKMVIRKETEAGDVTLEHATFNPLPTGTATDLYLKWDATASAWLAIPEAEIPSAGIPTGYEEETVNIVTNAGIFTRKILVETASKATVDEFAAADSRLLLGVNTAGVLELGKGYLKE